MNPLILERKESKSETLVATVDFQSFALDHLAHFEESDKNICSKIDLDEIMSVSLFSVFIVSHLFIGTFNFHHSFLRTYKHKLT